jgi:hypothetical protein
VRRAQILRSAWAVTLLLGIWSVGVQSGLGTDIQVDLDPLLDQYGSQIGTFQIYDDGSGQLASAFGIYDTGASVVTWSAYDQALSPLPIMVPGGAGAEGIGGTLTGDVSQPGQIIVGGMQAVDFLTLNYDPTKVAFAPGSSEEHGIQLLVGTSAGSPDLPTITGTPIHNGRLASNPGAPNGIAAKINMQWGLDLGALVTELLGGSDPMGLEELFQGVIWPMPDIEFVAPNTKLQAIPDNPATPLIDESTTQPVRIPLASYGVDNHASPGETITTSYNPFQHTGVVLSQGGTTLGNDPSHRLAMLVDTGASLSIISTRMAANLGLNLSAPEYSIEVQGAAGSVGTIPGFTIDSLELPVDDNGDGVFDGKVTFTHVPVFVYDVTPADTDPAEGLDGILGMNLFNYASEMLYDPFDPLGPSLSLTFLNNPYLEEIDPALLADLQALGLTLPQWAQSIGIPGVRGGPAAVPEPSTLVLLAAGGLFLVVWRLRRRRPA